ISKANAFSSFLRDEIANGPLDERWRNTAARLIALYTTLSRKHFTNQLGDSQYFSSP
ncbi:unnamed protein product, partial [Amoebophrya sp. A25]